MPAKSVTVSDDVYSLIYQISKDEKKSTARVMGELIEVSLDKELYEQLVQLRREKNRFFIEILKDVIIKGLQK